MSTSNNSNQAKSSVTPKSVAVVLGTIIIVLAAVIAISFGISFVAGKNRIVPEKVAEPEYTIQKDEATGADEYYDKDGEFMYKLTKEYKDAKNQELSREIYADKDNKTNKIVYYQADSKTVERVDEYNNGNVSKQHIYENGKDTGAYWTFDYNDKGILLTSIQYDKDGKIVIKKTNTYDKKGKIKLYEETDENGKTLSKTEYNYDKDGKEIKTVFYDANGVIGYVEYQYDSKGRKSRMDQYKDGKLIDYRIFKYDKDGAMTEEYFTADAEKPKS